MDHRTAVNSHLEGAAEAPTSALGQKRTCGASIRSPSNAEPYGGENQQTANDVVDGGALTQKQNGEYHD